MTNHVVRIYALVATIAVFFVAWAAIAAHPWAANASPSDPRLVPLAAREQKLRHDAAVVERVVKHRWAVYQQQLDQRLRQNAAIRRQAQAAPAPAATAAPQVQVVTLPPVTQSRAS